MSSHSSGRSIASLDGLRAISIGLVVMSHWVQTAGSAFPPTYEDFLGPLATLGVQVFFVISGFLITSLLLTELQQTGRIDLIRFYFRRTLRIFPAYYTYVILVVALSVLGFVGKLETSSLVPAVTYTSNYFGTGWIFGHSWSLAVEEQFYLIWPAILFVLAKRKSMWVAGIMMIAAPIIRALTYASGGSGYHFEVFMDGIAAGCLLAGNRTALAESRFGRYITRSPLVALMPIVIVIAAEATARPRTGLLFFAANSIIYVGIVVVMFAVTENSESLPARILNLKPVAAIGVLSYSIYVWQQILLTPGDGHFRFPWNVLLVIPVALLSYKLVESPMLSLRRNLDRRWFEKLPAARATVVSPTAGMATAVSES